MREGLFRPKESTIVNATTSTAPKRRPTASTLTGLATAILFALGTSAAQARFNLPVAPQESDFPEHSEEKIELGKLLFHDKILSGNENISCASCHHVLTYTSDGLSLPVGEGGIGLSVARYTGGEPPADPDGIHERVPRNSPQFFNAGAFEFTRMFWDGRVEVDAGEDSGFRTPAGDDTPPGLESALAAQALFPLTSHTEMAGQPGENEIANVTTAAAVWALIVKRLRDSDNHYIAWFQDAYPAGSAGSSGPVIAAKDISIVHVANAIAAYEDAAFRAINSPFDRYLRGDRRAMSHNQRAGMRLFYGKAGCSNCHSGSFQTDHDFHAVAVPQIGPGRGDVGPDGQQNADFGREQVTTEPADRYKFRTPSLRNTALTGPWGHDGAYNTLEAMVRHETDRAAGLEGYDTSQAVLPSREDLDALDFAHHQVEANRIAIAAAIDPLAYPVALSERQIGQLLEFLHALTDPISVDLRDKMPMTVPSGLLVAD